MSSFIIVKSIGINTFVPTDGGNPDWSSFTEPTLSILQTAYANGDYEIVPDPEPIVEQAVPNWSGFYDQLIVSQTYQYLLSNTIPNPSISGVMAVMGFSINDGKNDPSNPDRLKAFQASISSVLFAINAVGLSLSPEMMAEIRQLLDVNGLESIVLG